MSPLLLLIDIIAGLAIGVALGLLGGGGSILTVPALVYLIGQSPQAAVTTSLAVVGANSAFGAVFHQKRGALNGKIASLFSAAGVIAAYLGASLSKNISPALLMVLFALLMMIIGGVMLFHRRTEADQRPVFSQRSVWITLATGMVVGLLTGILGVGGGFLIVPALVMLVGLPMYQAVGTSLAIIAVNSFAGLLGHIGSPVDMGITAIFMLAGFAGTFLGARLAHRLPALILRKSFAFFVMMLGFVLLIDNMPKLLA